jgi:hypothetical protein
LVLLLGCGPRDEIRHFTLRKPQATHRLLGAMVPRGDRVWFLKVTGSQETLAPLSGPFESLVASLSFGTEPDARPKWVLPKGWTERQADGFRFATIEIPSAPKPLELAVSQVPVTSSDKAAFLLSSFNSWREQMGLKPIDGKQFGSSTKQITLASDKTLAVTLVDMAGFDANSGGHGQMSMGQMSMGQMPMGQMPPMGADDDDRPPQKKPKLGYDVPEGWKPGQQVISRGGIQVRRDAAFEVQEGAGRVEITITNLPANSNSLVANVNRWRKQVQLEEASAEQIAKDTKKIEVGPIAADYFQLDGPKESTLGVMVAREGIAWFVKLQGDPALAKREQQHFESFVKSLKFE